MFIEKSKEIHKEKEAHAYWPGAFDDIHTDTQRHHLMLSYALPVMQLMEAANVLTVGDSRARDAAFYKSKLGIYSVASDLSTSHLRPAVEEGYVDKIQDIDIEQIPCEDNSYDYVLAKETFHHWPRPMLGLYECIRVAKKGVILIEPSDSINVRTNSYGISDDYHDSYEEIGNYKYQVSLREICKAAWAMRLPSVIAKGFNDPYRHPLDMDVYLKEKNSLDLMGVENKRAFNLMFICINKIDFQNENALSDDYVLIKRPINSNEV